MKYGVAYYQKCGSDWMWNGCKLIVTESEYVLKCLFWTIETFPIEKTRACKIPNHFYYKGIKISDGTRAYHLYFYPRTAEKIYRQFRLATEEKI